MKGVEILQDIRSLGGDQDDKEILKRLVDIADILRLNESMLLPGANKPGEGRQQSFNPGTIHFHKLASHKNYGKYKGKKLSELRKLEEN